MGVWFKVSFQPGSRSAVGPVPDIKGGKKGCCSRCRFDVLVLALSNPRFSNGIASATLQLRINSVILEQIALILILLESRLAYIP
jgi:hypothetical protein